MIKLIGEDAAGVVRVDLDRLDISGILKKLDIPIGPEDQARIAAANLWVASLKKAVLDEIYLLLDPQDILETPTAVIPVGPNADAKAIGAMFISPAGANPVGQFAWKTTVEKPGALVIVGAKAEERIKNLAPTNRPQLAEAIEALKGSVVGIALSPSSGQRRTLEETIPELPQELGGGSITAVSKGMEWTILRFDGEPKLDLRLVAMAVNPAAAKELHTLYEHSLKLLESMAEKDKLLAPIAKGLGNAEAKLSENELTVNLSLTVAAAVIKPQIMMIRESARRSQCTNNEKQIALAMHNYLSAYGAFPAAYVASPEGKPLLSWRVLILPFLEQKELYDEFHLNEPWDSPHNKALIAKMPKTYVCPSADPKLAAEGKTAYLTPRAKESVFPGAMGVKIAEITDGTSNTILVVDAADSKAVTWTKPDDWETTEKDPWNGLLGHHLDGINACFADGAVRFLKMSIDPTMLWAIITKNGGEVINGDSL